MCRMMITDSLAWQNGSTMYKWLPQVYSKPSAAKLVDAFLKESAAVAQGLIKKTCAALAHDVPDLGTYPTFTVDCQGGCRPCMLSTSAGRHRAHDNLHLSCL